MLTDATAIRCRPQEKKTSIATQSQIHCKANGVVSITTPLNHDDAEGLPSEFGRCWEPSKWASKSAFRSSTLRSSSVIAIDRPR